MALCYPSLLKSPKFLCKYVQNRPPSAVVCYVHSQLSVRRFQDPLVSVFDLSKNGNCQMGCSGHVSLQNKEHGEVSSTSFVCHMPRKNRDIHSLRSVTTPNNKKPLRSSLCFQKRTAAESVTEFYQKAMDTSFLNKWHSDPLMDNKQVVLMVFKSNSVNRRLSFQHGNDFKEFATDFPPVKPQSNLLVSKRKLGQTLPVKEAGEVVKPCKETEKIGILSPTTSFSRWQYYSIAEAAILFTNFCSNPEMPKNAVGNGPDATQLSSVLLTLREEIPDFFVKIPNYDIYHKNVKFVNSICGATTHGIYAYRAQVSGVRKVLLSCMTNLTVEVLKITKHTDEGAIKVRWRIKGIPLIRKLAQYVGKRVKTSDAEHFRYFDGFSVFEVGEDGLIHCHKLHKVMPSSSEERDRPLWMLSYFALLRLLTPRPSESVGAFECWSSS